MFTKLETESNMEVLQSLKTKYVDLQKYCAQLHPDYRPPVSSVEKKEDCVGCVLGKSCLQFGIRLVDYGVPVYCDVDEKLKPQKKLGESAQNSYECLNNNVADGKCVSIEKRIQAVEEELKEQRNLIEKLFDFIKRLFRG